MCKCVEDGVEDYEVPCQAVEPGVLVQGKQVVEALLPELGHGEPQHRQQDEHAREVEALPRRARHHQRPRAAPVDVDCVPVLSQPRHEQAEVGDEEEDVEEDELRVVADVGEGNLPRNGHPERVIYSLELISFIVNNMH